MIQPDDEITPQQRKALRRLGHGLRPVVTVGERGLTKSLLAECVHQLDHHELIKIRAPGLDKEDRRALFESICQTTGASLVQTIGRVALVYRRRDGDAVIDLGKPRTDRR